MARLRAATPLALLLLVSLALLIISIVSVPISQSIVLATNAAFQFGVFGYCNNNQCTRVQVGYDPSALDSNSTDFSLPSSARHSLSNLLIVHVVAAGLTLVCLVLAVLAHVRGAAHSPRYLLILAILLIPTIILTLLSFLVDILLFVPHLAWGGWIVLAATVLNAGAGIMTCTMRRILVSQKAMRKRIAENADMNGANFYTRQMEERAAMEAQKYNQTTPRFAEFEVERGEDPSRVSLNQLNRRQYPYRGPRSYNQNGAAEELGGEAYGSEVPTYVSNHGRSHSGSMRGGPMRIDGGAGTRLNRDELPAMPIDQSFGRFREPEAGYTASYRPTDNASNPGHAVAMPRGPRELAPLTIPNQNPESATQPLAYGAPPPRYGSPYQGPPRRRQVPPAGDEYVGHAEGRNGDGYLQRSQPAAGEEYARDYTEPAIPLSNALPTQRQALGELRGEDPRDDGSVYSEYVAPRQAWKQRPRTSRGTGSDIYYEDTEPRFSDPSSQPYSNPRRNPPAGPRSDDGRNGGSRSPAPSVSSHFTSVSQRGVNPWYVEGPQAPPRQSLANMRRQRQQDMIFSGNPDFELPSRGGRRRAPGAIPGVDTRMPY